MASLTTRTSGGLGASSAAQLSSARSTSLAKLLLLLTSAAGHLLAPAMANPLPSVLEPLRLGAYNDSFNFTSARHGGGAPEEPRTTLQLVVDILSILGLVLLGGVFAGLTLGLMGLDMVNLQVLSTSGSEVEKKHSLKVLKLLEKGRHWVLVVLLLGNVVGEC